MTSQRRKSDLAAWFRDKREVLTFKVVLLFIDLAFYASKVRQWFLESTTGRKAGFEDALQEQVRPASYARSSHASDRTHGEK